MHTDGKSGAPGNAQSNEDIRSGEKNGAEGGKAAVKAASGRRRVRPYCIAMALAALIVLVLPVLIRQAGAQEAAAYLVPVLAVTVLPALIIYLTVLRKLMADRELARRGVLSAGRMISLSAGRRTLYNAELKRSCGCDCLRLNCHVSRGYGECVRSEDIPLPPNTPEEFANRLLEIYNSPSLSDHEERSGKEKRQDAAKPEE